MFYLVVAIFLAAATTPVDTVVYNVQTWETKAACEAFVASDAGKASLAGLLAVVKAAPQGGSDATLIPVCTDDLKPYQK